MASGAFMPARALGAPQTICTVAEPVFTWHTLSVSALGCGTRSTISPTMTPGSGGAAAATPSISSPAIVRRAARSFGAGSGPPIHSLNHCRLMRIVFLPAQPNWRRKRRSFSKYRRMSLTL